MSELFARLAEVAPSELNVLVSGETGTGKELVAQCLHQGSSRAQGPFVVFDCSAVAATLAESELFGHERGAFTGAVCGRAGVFEQAHGGTLLLDELGELPKDLQPKLLRVLERREVRRLGSSRVIPIDIRLVAATHRNLRAEVARGAFRDDLYFRVAGALLDVPPLRERLDDLPALVEHFLSEAAPPRDLRSVPAETWQQFRRHQWPGNVRELRNAVGRLLLSPERALPEHDLFEDAAPVSSIELRALRLARREVIDRFERSYVTTLLKRTQGNVSAAAAIAQVSRQSIHKLIAKHGL
jgi:transcriptional regulator with PAS, ATPase and Fis domain